MMMLGCVRRRLDKDSLLNFNELRNFSSVFSLLFFYDFSHNNLCFSREEELQKYYIKESCCGRASETWNKEIQIKLDGKLNFI